MEVDTVKENLTKKSLAIPTPVLVIATYDAQGRANAMTAAWGGICCSDPLCVAVSLRKATYTYGNLMETQAFTMNIPGRNHMREADYFGIASGKKEDKFARTGLTAMKSDFVNAPYVEEFPVNIECKIINILELGLHTQFIGEVVNVKVDSELLKDGVSPSLAQVMPLIFAPGGGYYTLGEEVGKPFSAGRDLTAKS